MSQSYTISDLAKEFDLTTRAIRFYEDMGLLSPQREGVGGRSRVYSARDRTRLKLTLRSKRLGLSPTEAKDIIARIKKGAKFDEIAKKSSKDPGSGAKGGDLDWSNPGGYVKEFSEALMALGKGKMTETPVKTQFGYHVIRLDDTRDAQLPKFDDVKAQIAQQLQQQKIAKYQEELRAKAKIE